MSKSNKTPINFNDETHQYFKITKFSTQNITLHHTKYEQLHKYDNYNYNAYTTINSNVSTDTISVISEHIYQMGRSIYGVEILC